MGEFSRRVVLLTMINEKQLHRFFQGLSTEEESTLILRWLADIDADHRTLEKYMESQWLITNEAIESRTDDRILNNLRNRLYPEPQTIVPGRRLGWLRYAIAACVIGILILSGIYFTGFLKTSLNNSGMQWVEVKNEGLETTRIVLPDSSSAWLSSGSKLYHQSDFLKSGERRVRVEGEVFFDVVHQDNHPLLVYTGNIHTTVLGTAFNVEAYPQEPDIRISLVRGKVAVQKDSGTCDTEILNPGEMISWNRNDNHVLRGNFSQINIDDWKKGYFIFNDVPLSYALDRIARRYHLTIQYGEEADVSRAKITTILKHNQLNELLQIFPFVTPFQYSIQNDFLLVTRKVK